MKTILIQIPLLADKKAEWDLMINHPEGIALARKQTKSLLYGDL